MFVKNKLCIILLRQSLKIVSPTYTTFVKKGFKSKGYIIRKHSYGLF